MKAHALFLISAAFLVGCGSPPKLEETVWLGSTAPKIEQYRLESQLPGTHIRLEARNESGSSDDIDISFRRWATDTTDMGEKIQIPTDFAIAYRSGAHELVLEYADGEPMFWFDGERVGLTEPAPEIANPYHAVVLAVMQEPSLLPAFRGALIEHDSGIRYQAVDQGRHIYTRWSGNSHVFHKGYNNSSPGWAQTLGGTDCNFCWCCPGIETNSSGSKRVYDSPTSGSCSPADATCHAGDCHCTGYHTVW